jgi:hypothetical protein
MSVYWHISCDLRCSVNRCIVSGCIFKSTKQLFSPCSRNCSRELQSFTVILRDGRQRIFRGYIAPEKSRTGTSCHVDSTVAFCSSLWTALMLGGGAWWACSRGGRGGAAPVSEVSIVIGEFFVRR